MGRGVLLLWLTLVLALSLAPLHGGASVEDSNNDNASDPSRKVIKSPLSDEVLAEEWKVSKKRAVSSDEFTFFVSLSTGKEGEVERVAAAVSDPRSPSYGKFLSQLELRELVQAPPEVEREVQNWLRTAVGSAGGSLSIKSYGDVLKVSTTVGTAERIFETRISELTHRASGRSIKIITRDATIPTDIGRYVRGVVGLCDVSFMKSVSAWRYDEKSASVRRVDLIGSNPAKRQRYSITPDDLRARYNVSSSLMASSSVSQAVVSFNDLYSATALANFSTSLGYPIPQVTQVNSTIAGNTPCSSYDCYASAESDLDLQYITGMGRNAANFFHLNDNNGYSTYYWALEVANSASPAMVYSMSWGAPETTDDGIPYSDIDPTEEQLAKMAARGISVLVASGDTGAAGGSEACPLDTSRYCFLGGCAHTTTACAQIYITDSDGSRSFPGTTYGTFQQSTLDSITSWLGLQTGCESAIEVDKIGYEWLYTNCSCSRLNYRRVRGVKIQNYASAIADSVPFIQSYPATSAWVTAVGATEWTSQGVETTGTIERLSWITSGGGFSAAIPQPAWQSSFVQAYLSSARGLPPSSTFSSSNRAYPDISLLGHNYLILYGGSSAQDTPYWVPVDGTSASTPALAGLITLINKMRIDSGKSQLGFLNPALYQMKVDRPDAFVDVNTGTINGTMGYVCKYGFPATDGWDAATGLGVPNFGVFAEYLANYVAPSPSASPSQSRTPSATPSPSASRTPEPTKSRSPTPSRSSSPTRSPSRSSSPTPSVTRTSRTPSRTPSPSRSPSRSPTPSRSASPSRSPSRSPRV